MSQFLSDTLLRIEQRQRSVTDGEVPVLFTRRVSVDETLTSKKKQYTEEHPIVSTTSMISILNTIFGTCSIAYPPAISTARSYSVISPTQVKRFWQLHSHS